MPLFNGINNEQLTQTTGVGYLGIELITSGNFLDASKWSSNNYFDITDGIAHYDKTHGLIGSINQDFTLTKNKFYKITLIISNASTYARVNLGGSVIDTAIGTGIGGSYQQAPNGNNVFYMKALKNDTKIVLYASPSGSSFDLINFSIKEIDTSDGEIIDNPTTSNFSVDGVVYIYSLKTPSIINLPDSITNYTKNILKLYYGELNVKDSRLLRVSNNQWEIAQVNIEYISPEQHGSIYGIIYRTYFGSSLPSYLTSTNATTKLIDYLMYLDFQSTDEHIIRSWSADDTIYGFIKRIKSSGALQLVINNFTCLDGWVDYVK